MNAVMREGKKTLLVSNMYPSEKFPNFGTFVKTSEEQLLSCDITVDKVVIDEVYSNLIHKILGYLSFYISTFIRCVFGSYDYVYIQFISHSSPPVILARFFKRFEIISHIHGGDITKLKHTSNVGFLLKRYISQRIINLSSVVVFPSESYAKFAESNFTISNYIVYPSGGVDPKVFKSTANKLSSYKVGYAGRLVASKNVDSIVQAIALVDKSVRLEIVGDGKDRNMLEDLVASLGISDRVRFLGKLSQTELAKWYSSIDVLVYPSDSESLGLVPLEAMSCGVYCILSDIPAFLELKEKGFDFDTVSPTNSEEISSMISNFYAVGNINKERLLENSKLVSEIYGSENAKKKLYKAFC
ncbi:glycosyltransferase family 4 protein [Vibrio cyclitrophicus]